jgi:RNA polymerase subunit RPABC4/transcription elongation factor Spt4
MLICKNCSTPVSESQTFCPNCFAQSDSFIQTEDVVPVIPETEEMVAASLETEETVSAGPGLVDDSVNCPPVHSEAEDTVPASPETVIDSNFQPNVKKKSKKPMFIGFAVIILAVLAVSAFAMKDLLKSPKQRYIDSESKYFIGMFANIKAESDKAIAEMNKKVEQKMNLTVSPDLSAYTGANSMVDTATLGRIGEIVKGISIESNSKIDTSNNAFISDFNLKLKGNTLINGTVAMDKDRELLKFPQFYDKTFVINFKELGKSLKNLGISDANIPDRILQRQDIIDVIKIDNAALKEVGKKYAQIYFDAIPDDQVKSESESLAIKDEKISCRKLTVSMKKDDLIKLLENLVNEAGQDEVLKQLIFENAKNVMKLYKDAGYFGTEEVDIDTMLEDSNYTEFFSTMKKGIQDMKDNLNLEYGIVMTLWVNNKGDIIKREIKSSVTDDNTKTDILYAGTEYYTNTLTVQNYSLKLEDNESDTDPETLTIDISRESEKAKKNSKEGSDKFLVTGELKGGATDNGKVNISVNTRKTLVDNVLNGDTEFIVDLGEINVSGTVNLKNSENEKLKEETDNYDIKLKIVPSTASEDVIKGNIKLDLVTKADVDVDLSSLIKGDYVEFDKLDSMQLEEIGMEIQQKAMEFIQLNQSIFEEFLY